MDGRRLHFNQLFLDGEWKADVGLSVTGDGTIAAQTFGAAEENAERVTGWCVPGVPNVHSHAFQRGLAGLAEGGGPDSFWSWRDVMYRFLAELTPDDVTAIARQLFVELLKHGFTAVGEFHYLHNDPTGNPYADRGELSRRLIAAANEVGIGLTLLPALYEVGGFDERPLEGGQRRFELTAEGMSELREALANELSPSIRVGGAIHSLRAIRAGSLPDALTQLGRAHTPVRHIHVSEQEREVSDSVAARGARPVEWLLANTEVDGSWCLIHATHLSEAEVAQLANCGAVVGLCPATEANLGDGIFPLPEFARRGGRYAIGTDSHVSRSPAEELRILEYGQRLTLRRRGVAGESASEDGVRSAGVALLEQAWENGARAVGLPGSPGHPGSRADFVVLDPEHAALVGREGTSVLDSWIFSGPDNPVRDVMVGGRWVVQAGRHPGEEQILGAYSDTVRRIKGRI